MKRYALIWSCLRHVTGLMQLVFVFLIWPLTNACFGNLAPSTNTIPWSDDFENQYTNLTPLIDGTNGWYAASSAVVVQTNTVRSGTYAAMIPVDCTLSNRFVTNTAMTNIWIQMDVRPTTYDGQTNYNGTCYADYPVVDTNLALMFYVNSNGNFLVHDGPATNPSPTNSLSWIEMMGGTPISTNALTWVQINIYEDFAKTNYNLYKDGILMTNAVGFKNIRFINPYLTNFAGFDIYNGAATSYLDNVSVVNSETSSCPLLIVVPSALSQNNMYAGVTPPVTPNDQTVQVINVWSTDIGFLVRTNQAWITNIIVSPPGGTVAKNSTTELKLQYASTINWPAGMSNATVTVVATNAASPNEWGTQTVQVVLNMIALSNVLYVTPTWFSNDVWQGATPTNRTFEVRNLGDLSFDYTVVVTGAAWLVNLSNETGTLGAYGTNTLTLTNNESTAGWELGTSNAYVNVVASNTGVLATQVVNVAVNVLNISNVLEVIPMTLTSTVWTGDAPTNQTFVVNNKSDASFVYNVTTGAVWITNSLPGGPIVAKGSITGTLTYGKTVNWVFPGSNSWVKVATTDGSGATNDIIVTVNVIDFAAGTLQVAPTDFTNSVWIGDTPTNRTFQVWNTGALSLVYSVTETSMWVSGVTAGGTLPAYNTNTITITYIPTWRLTTGTSNATVKVVSSNGYGMTQDVMVTLIIGPAATNYYVATNGGDVWPYTNWDGAASNLTSAVYKANFYTNVSSVVWLSNGVYNLTNQVTLSNITIRSVNGAESVTLNGGSFRGFTLVHTGAVLNGLTITNCNAGRGTNGGAVFVATGLVWNCRLLGNSASNGGGVAVGNKGVVRDCLIWGNKATNGGGVYYVNWYSGRVENCTIASNYAAGIGGGLYTATSTTGLCMNAVVYQNSAGGSYSNWGTNSSAELLFTNSCVSPTNEVHGLNNIDSNPFFVNVTNGNCRLTSGSPCFNKGTNQAWMVNAFDLAGNIRVRFGQVDIGAYEWYPYQGLKINGVPYEKIKFINGTEPLKINDIRNSSP